MKRTILFFLVLASTCFGKSTTSVPTIEGDILHTIQSAWIIAESENSGDTQTDALAATERTRAIVDRLIAANANEEAQISVLPLPSKWNAMRFRGIGITDGGTLTHQIYLGTLGGDLDCSLTYAGQLAWTIGTQTSIYYQIAFTLGGADGAAYVPQPGDTVTGNDSSETAVIVSIVETASTWSAGTAAGTITYRSSSGTFTNLETVSIKRANKVLASDALKHASSDLVAFELADAVTVTAGAWLGDWDDTSPADDTNAEAKLDVTGADYMVVVTSATSADSKLLVTGY